MPSENPAVRLQDIVENARAILGYTEGLSAEAFGQNRLVYDAVERCLERISEAAAKLGEQAALLVPNVPWHDIRVHSEIACDTTTARSARTVSGGSCRMICPNFSPVAKQRWEGWAQ